MKLNENCVLSLNRTLTYSELSSTLWLIQSITFPRISGYFFRSFSCRAAIFFSRRLCSRADMGFISVLPTRTILACFLIRHSIVFPAVGCFRDSNRRSSTVGASWLRRFETHVSTFARWLHRWRVDFVEDYGGGWFMRKL